MSEFEPHAACNMPHAADGCAVAVRWINRIHTQVVPQVVPRALRAGERLPSLDNEKLIH